MVHLDLETPPEVAASLAVLDGQGKRLAGVEGPQGRAPGPAQPGAAAPGWAASGAPAAGAFYFVVVRAEGAGDLDPAVRPGRAQRAGAPSASASPTTTVAGRPPLGRRHPGISLPGDVDSYRLEPPAGCGGDRGAAATAPAGPGPGGWRPRAAAGPGSSAPAGASPNARRWQAGRRTLLRVVGKRPTDGEPDAPYRLPDAGVVGRGLPGPRGRPVNSDGGAGQLPGRRGCRLPRWRCGWCAVAPPARPTPWWPTARRWNAAICGPPTSSCRPATGGGCRSSGSRASWAGRGSPRGRAGWCGWPASAGATGPRCAGRRASGRRWSRTPGAGGWMRPRCRHCSRTRPRAALRAFVQALEAGALRPAGRSGARALPGGRHARKLRSYWQAQPRRAPPGPDCRASPRAGPTHRRGWQRSACRPVTTGSPGQVRLVKEEGLWRVENPE